MCMAGIKRSREGGSGRETQIDRWREKDRDGDRVRDSESESERARARARERESESERARGRGRERESERAKECERERAKEGEREQGSKCACRSDPSAKSFDHVPFASTGFEKRPGRTSSSDASRADGSLALGT
eukprot:6213103-Pleurochrysis_carterae.AAC.2